MALTSGVRLGPYEIAAPIGAGGMGEVYRARDTRLNRDVALKVLPDTFAADPDRLARFRREAQVLAALNHPNIAAIHGLEETGGGVSALVLELVEGPTLADRIAQGPIPLDEALPIARQIAEALEAAHERGIIHRDLKPANVKVREDGTVKVLDFGLAKALEGEPAAADVSQSPTLSVAATRAGVILGTAAYMAPEQARGKAVDRRADIWAFGCVLYEMLTGRRAFGGDDLTDTLAFIITKEPDWSTLPANCPDAIRTLLKRCMEKDRQKRLPHIGVARIECAEGFAGVAPAQAAAIRPKGVASNGRVAWSLAAVFLAAAIAFGVTAFRTPERTDLGVITRFVVNLPTGEQFSNTGRPAVAISPLGTHIVYSANGRLDLRALDQLERVPVRGTEGNPSDGTSSRHPFFSPDGQWIAFWQSGQLKKVSVTGGAPVTICAATIPFGATWGTDDTILFGAGPDGISRVSAAGGTPEVLITVDAGQSAHGPQMLPGGRAVLFTLRPQGGAWDESQIVVQSLDVDDRKVLIDGGTDARYVPTGHLVYALQGTLLAVPFDVDALEVTGGPVPLVENIARPGLEQTGAAHFSVSADGTLVYIPDAAGAIGNPRGTLVWVDREGREEPLTAPARAYGLPRLSPDGQRIALEVQDEQRDIWIWHLTGETLTRLTLNPAQDQSPVWTPDGRRVIFSSTRTGVLDLFWQLSDGTGAVERLLESVIAQFPTSVSPDGTKLVVRRGLQGGDLMLLPLQGERRLEPLVQTRFQETNAEISPGGRWLAYESNESGRPEIYVRPFPNVNDGRWQVSAGGGMRPLWARSGQELFYLTPDFVLMRAPISSTPVFKSGNPVKMFDASAYSPRRGPGRTYDVSPDGRRFLMIKPSTEGAQQTRPPDSVIVVQNWFEELKKRVPVN